MSDPTSTPESVPEPRWKCRADHFVYGYCDGPVGARPGHNSCGWSAPAAASSPDEGASEDRCARDAPASADEGTRQRPGEMTFTADSPRPELQVLVGQHGGRPCVDIISLLAFFRDSAAWNEVAGEPEKIPGFQATVDALWGLHQNAKARLDAAPPAPSTPAPQPETVCDCCGAHRVIGWAGVCEPCWTYINAMPLPATPPSTPAEPEQADG